jgi:hypothetical protein
MPLCDEVFVALGKSDDETEELIKSIDPYKIKIIKTLWDETLKEGGKVLAVETNKAFQAIPAYYDWCFYIQGDEVIHEKYLPIIKSAMIAFKNNPKIDGLRTAAFVSSIDKVAISYMNMGIWP